MNKAYMKLTNSEIEYRINEHVHSKRDREILRLKLIDGCTYEQIGYDYFNLSPRYVYTIVRKYDEIFSE